MRSFDPGPEGSPPDRRGRRRGEGRRRGDGFGGGRGDRREHRHVHGGFARDFGFDPTGSPRDRRRGRGRAGRGDVRAAIISLLGEEPRNGYQIIQEINERTGGLWRVSSGSVYPTFSQLEDEGLIEPTDGSGRKLFALTQAGREHAEQNAGQLARLWEAGAEDARSGEFLQYRELMGQLAAATRQVYEVGTQAQREEAKQVLTHARRSLYKLLAADAAEDAAEPARHPEHGHGDSG
ncbi:MAG TPA: PadR family transcriptional regulator [Streptosporangiaceae bacterium]